RKNQSYDGTGNRGIATTSKGNVSAGQPRVVKCYDCQGEGHMARQCTQIKRPRNAAWFKEKLMLAEAQEASQILDKEQLAFLVDPDDLDVYDSDSYDLSSAKVVLMENLSSCDPKVLSEVPYSDSYPNDMINQDVQEMQYSKQTHVDDFQDNEIHSGSNIIMYSQYLQDSQDAEIDTLKETLSNSVEENESLSKTLTVFKTESKEKESKYIDKEIVLEKQNKELENIIYKMYRSTQVMHMLMKPQVFYDDTHKQALGYQNLFHLKKTQRIQPTLYDGSVIAKEHVVIFIIDDEETLILEEESRSKMLDKQNDPISIEKKIKISPIDYSKLNKIKEDFGKRFVTQKELSAEQAFWLKHSSFSETPVTSHTPVRIEAPSELPKVSLVNESLKKLKYQLANFDNVVKKRTTSDAITAGAWGFEHTKACFVTEIIPFLKVLKDTFNAFDKTLLDEITEVQTVFNQMEAAVNQCSVDKNAFEIQIKQLSIDNDQLLKQIMSQEIVHIAVNSVDILDVKKSCVNECNKCLELETKLLKKKSVENSDLNAQLQEKVFAIAALKNELRKLKGKNVVDTVVSKPSATIAPGMFKLDIEPISHRLKNNRDAHETDSLKTKDSNKPLLTSTGVKPTTSVSGSKPLGRTFTIVGNRCPLTRITSTKVVPTKETSTKIVVTPTQGILVYSRRPKATRSIGSSSKVVQIVL
ncbi:retrovirus-related pol polyprotein from transposon TNT 1-94, partial [Tanacetum coccineum]